MLKNVFKLAFSVVVWGLIGHSDKAFADDIESGWQSELVYHEAVLRQYRYYVPSSFSSYSDVVVLLHDAGENMNSILGKGSGGMLHWLEIAERDGVVLLVPNGTDLKTGKGRGRNLNWNDCRPRTLRKGKRSFSDDKVFLVDSLKELKFRLGLKEPRVYAVGIGLGGLMAMRMGFEEPSEISAVGALMCSLPLNPSCDPLNIPFPLILLCGTKDPVFQWMGGPMNRKQGYAASVPQSRKRMILYNKCRRSDVRTIKCDDINTGDGSRVTYLHYPGMLHGADFRFVQVLSGGHLLPSIQHPVSRRTEKRLGKQNKDIEAVEFVWEFLKTYSSEIKRAAKPESPQVGK